jgi:hypothetical protein
VDKDATAGSLRRKTTETSASVLRIDSGVPHIRKFLDATAQPYR